MNEKLELFKEQIQEDLALIKDNIKDEDERVLKNEFAFNYWILLYLYSIEEEFCYDQITEYNDKGIDCFVIYEENKELFIIQNKYYQDDTNLNTSEFSDFSQRPVASLLNGNYKNDILQTKFNEIINKNDWNINLHFYITNETKNKDIDNIINSYQAKDTIKCQVKIDFFNLEKIWEKYYKEAFIETSNLEVKFTAKNKGTFLRILPDEYDLAKMTSTYYVMTKVTDIYTFKNTADEKKYPLFEKNIREYLGTGGINKKIIETLIDDDEREKFFYYNNGITIICKKVKLTNGVIKITNPQIVNGCQTVNSIVKALNQYKEEKERDKIFDSTFVMTKILEVEENKKFYRDVVKYTNSQNAINGKVFGSTSEPFFRIQKSLKKRGVLLLVKQSDRNQFKDKYKGKDLNKLLKKANKDYPNEFYEFKKLGDCQISLENLLQIIGSFTKDAYFAFVYKASLLIPTNHIYEEFSNRVNELMTIDDIKKLIFFYKKSELDKKNNSDSFPIPYYLLFFLSKVLKSKEIKLKDIKTSNLECIYKFIKPMSKEYFDKYKEEEKPNEIENNFIKKKKIKVDLANKIVQNEWKSLEKYNQPRFEELTNILKKQ